MEHSRAIDDISILPQNEKQKFKSEFKCKFFAQQALIIHNQIMREIFIKNVNMGTLFAYHRARRSWRWLGTLLRLPSVHCLTAGDSRTLIHELQTRVGYNGVIKKNQNL